jgi:hypothetical protein
MNQSVKFIAIAAVLCLFVGCQPTQTASVPPADSASTTNMTTEQTTAQQSESEDAIIAKAISELPAAEQTEASMQKYCAVQTKQLLGTMGMPYKVMLDGQPVYLCCAGCKGKATRNPKETLAHVAELKANNANSP